MVPIRSKYSDISIEMEYFNNTESQPVDRFEIVPQISNSRDQFVSNVIDIGPNETFRDYNFIHATAALINQKQIKTRLVTSGKYFIDQRVTIRWFNELYSAGTIMILLSLDGNDLGRLPYENVRNYLTASAYVGQRPYIRFFLNGPIPEGVYQLLRNIEDQIFHNDLFFFKKRTVISYERDLFPLYEMYPQEFRVVISRGGEVILRKHCINETIEINIGSLKENKLANIIDTDDLFGREDLR